MRTDTTQAQDIPYREYGQTLPPVLPTLHFMMQHPAHWLAMGFGSGLSQQAPGTMGTLWAWAMFALLQDFLTPWQWGGLIAIGIPVGWWACTVTAQNMRVNDPSSVVWDEIAAFWLVLWLVCPTGFWGQFTAFLLFRFFDAAKPGPVRWADQMFHAVNPAKDQNAWLKAGWGIMQDDLVAAFCTLLVIALWRAL
jgi:phosphatidylglycerophosphatase A